MAKGRGWASGQDCWTERGPSSEVRWTCRRSLLLQDRSRRRSLASKDCKDGYHVPCSIRLRCARLRSTVQCSIEESAISLQLFLSSARFRLSFASPIAERSTDQLTLPLFPPLSSYPPSMLPERPMKIEVVVDPSRLAPIPSLASRVAPAENTGPVTNGTQVARSVPVPPLVSVQDHL